MGQLNNVLAAFSEEQTERLTGISRTQLRYWDRTEFYSPSFGDPERHGAFSRVYSFKDIVALRVLNVLRNQYKISLQHLREVSEKLGSLQLDPSVWTETKLYPLNGRVVWYEPGSELPQIIASGQYVAAVVLDEVVQATKHDVASLQATRSNQKIGHVEKSRYVVRNAPVLAGTRISVGAIKRFTEAGYSPAQILLEYPDLTEEDIHAALAYEEKKSSAA